MIELFYLIIAFIVMWVTLYFYFINLIKKYVKENFVVLLEYFLRREALSESENSELLSKLFD